ncbi:3-phosphoshikimate 1-carboxyvinyltransferase [Candidatus Curculioniphilus buchneri]|uniref:3-phosphoshikimate 1-carboxyvinyltransferase n=1 Tax=Candidatus Curculioniphilus buchneri TaxID=690594 RepID=UPI00376F0D4A
MQETLTLHPISCVNGTLNLPGSKSVSNRALLLAAQASGTTRLINLLKSDDVFHMLTALNQLGITCRVSQDHCSCEVDGSGGPLRSNNNIPPIFLGNAGTAMRPLVAALSLQSQEITLTGESRMNERPIGHLVDALCQGGAKIEYLGQKNYPPLRLHGGYRGGNIVINGDISSQFLTALLMMAPLAPLDSYIRVKGTLVSQPYINITIELMKCFGIQVEHDNYQTFYIQGGRTYCSPRDYLIEGDASSASYFLAAAAIRGGTVRVHGIGRHSLQGDIRFADALEKMGATICWGDNFIECTRGTLNSIDIDVNHIPDAAMTLATTALFATNGGTTTLRNIYNWRVKETDRLIAMATELRKVGAIVTEGRDFIKITPPRQLTSASISTYNDHRMAMCFSLVALSNTPVVIMNPQCTHKTFPNFFDQLKKLSTLI